MIKTPKNIYQEEIDPYFPLKKESTPNTPQNPTITKNNGPFKTLRNQSDFAKDRSPTFSPIETNLTNKPNITLNYRHYRNPQNGLESVRNPLRIHRQFPSKESPLRLESVFKAIQCSFTQKVDYIYLN